MNFHRIKKEFGDRLVFHGGIDIQQLLLRGTVSGVEAKVKEVIEILAPGGGYILASSHNIQENTLPENMIAMFTAARKFGEHLSAIKNEYPKVEAALFI